MIENALMYLFQVDLVLFCIALVVLVYVLFSNFGLRKWTDVTTKKYGLSNLRAAFQLNKNSGFAGLNAVMCIENNKLRYRNQGTDDGVES
ncbi:hypothetical protein [Photobacterium damselae]|uniref:hypothetical protein n=1 Tax=Photobacterium damselae TaxID=38293 RepID=UPI0040679D9D